MPGYSNQLQRHQYGNAWYSRLISNTHSTEEFVAGALGSGSGSVFVWGNGPQVYALSGRRPASRFVHTLALSYDYAIHSELERNRADLMATFDRTPPRVIAIGTPWLRRAKTLDFPELAALIARDYGLTKRAGNPDLRRLADLSTATTVVIAGTDAELQASSIRHRCNRISSSAGPSRLFSSSAESSSRSGQPSGWSRVWSDCRAVRLSTFAVGALLSGFEAENIAVGLAAGAGAAANGALGIVLLVVPYSWCAWLSDSVACSIRCVSVCRAACSWHLRWPPFLRAQRSSATGHLASLACRLSS